MYITLQRTRDRSQAGVGLIELLVSVLVLSVGLVALARLQIELVRGAADSRARSAAVALAEEKLEDLRTYGVVTGTGGWSAGATQQAWSWIADNQGGRLAPQAAYSSTLELEGVRYTRTWDVTDVNFTASVGPAAALAQPYKDVTVTVAWQDNQGDTQQVQLTASIMNQPPGNVISASSPVTARPPGPDIVYTPGAAPEIISVPIDVGGGKRRETTKPLPDVVGHSGTNVVRFDVVNYHANGNEFIVDKREEFVTVNCACQMGTAGPARTPARALFQNGVLKDVPGLVVTKTRGNYTANGSNSDDVCIICCRDHFDYSSGGTNYFYRPTDNTAHQHYAKSVNGAAVGSPVNSGTYDEACRLKRVNGVFQVFEDWNLTNVTVLPGTFLTTAQSQQAYTTYVQNLVQSVVMGGSTPTRPAGRDTSVVSGQFNQLFGRAIYVDVPSGLASYIQGRMSADPTKVFADFLGLVPFYEINLTKLADWATLTSANVVRATSSDIVDDLNPCVDILGNPEECPYSRGRAEGAGPSSTPSQSVRVMVSLKPANSGITGTPAIRPNEDGIHTRTLAATVSGKKYYTTATDPTTETPSEHKDDSILVAFSGTPTGPVCPGDPSCPPTPPVCPGDPSCPPATTVFISGDLFKSSGASGQPQKTVTASFAGDPGYSSGSCRMGPTEGAAGPNDRDYSCEIPTGWYGNIVFSPSSNQYCVTTGCPAGSALTGDQRHYSDVTTGFGNEDLYVKN